MIILMGLVLMGLVSACATNSVSTGPAGGPTATPSQHKGEGTPLALPTATPQQPVGAKAISPSKPGEVPAFTEQDVTQYLQTHPLPHATSSNVTVLKVQFVTGQDVTGFLQGEPTGFPQNYPMCFVELQGIFHFSGPPPPDKESPGYQYAFVVFDAANGNLLLFGGLAKPV
jgi:hypothetical protein